MRGLLFSIAFGWQFDSIQSVTTPSWPSYRMKPEDPLIPRPVPLFVSPNLTYALSLPAPP